MSSSGRLLAELRKFFSETVDACNRCNSSESRNASQPVPNQCPSLTNWSTSEHRNFQVMCSGKKCSWIIPLGGNGFIRNTEDPNLHEVVNPCGLGNWTNSQSIISVYFHSTRPGKILIALRLKVPNGSSTLNVTIVDSEGQGEGHRHTSESESKVNVGVSGSEYQLVPCGRFQTHAGYVRMDLQGVNKTGEYFADVSHVLIVPEADFFLEQTNVKFVADPADFYFGRRGPSVHLRYLLPPSLEGKNLEYFYTELTVPQNQDVIGAYFCAAGFSGGYCGIQVNSSTERRVLFSIWSAWQTDNPGDIPDDYKIVLLKKGPGVISGEFGDEGSGGQSYLVYPWTSETTYRFLIYTTPLDDENTIYTAWFNPTQSTTSGWMLLASFRKPKDSTYLRDLYAFSENFIPEMGHVERRCIYGNQWVNDASQTWTELTEVEFTADATAAKEDRKDICGGLHPETGQFFLRNCGFFSDSTERFSKFQRNPLGIQPQINFADLP